jgi:hypothetical protein
MPRPSLKLPKAFSESSLRIALLKGLDPCPANGELAITGAIRNDLVHFRPARNQAPLHQIHLPLACFFTKAHNRLECAGGDVVPRWRGRKIGNLAAHGVVLCNVLLVASSSVSSTHRNRIAPVTAMSGIAGKAVKGEKTEEVCPLAPASGAALRRFTLKRAAPGYASSMRRTVRTLVPAPMKVSEGNSSQIPPHASTMGLSLSFCLGPFAQMAPSRPPGFKELPIEVT